MRPQHGRGLAWTDWNRDGKVDLLTTPTHSAAQLLQNESDVPGRGLTVRLIGTDSPRQPVGVIVEMVASSGSQTKQLIGGGSYASTSLSEIHFGIPKDAQPTELHVTWPLGGEQSILIKADDDQMIVIEQHLSR